MQGGVDEETGGGGKKTRSEKEGVGKENSTPSHPPALRKRAPPPRQQPTSVVAMDVEMTLTAAGNSQLSKATASDCVSDRCGVWHPLNGQQGAGRGATAGVEIDAGRVDDRVREVERGPRQG